MSKKILIFAQGTIGDMVTAMPAMQRLRGFFKGDILHLHNTYPGANASHTELFRHLDLFDDMRFTRVETTLCKSLKQRFLNWLHLHREHYDLIFELPNNRLSPRWLMKSFGAKQLVTMDEISPQGMPRYRFLLDFLDKNGIPRVPDDENICWRFTPEEQAHSDMWMKQLPLPEGSVPFALCVGGKNQLQHWPIERYTKVLTKLLDDENSKLFPIIFGASPERQDAEMLIRTLGVGIFIQDLPYMSLREEILALRKCAFYFGNDTGVMHLAGAAGIPVFSICSARAPTNYWRPLSKVSRILTANIPCHECRNTICPKGNPAPCITQISADMVYGEIRSFITLLSHNFYKGLRD